MVKMKTLKKWNLIINLVFILFYFTMSKLPYRVIITRNLSVSQDIKYVDINIPKYFANYTYFKIKLKEVDCGSSREQDIWMNCDTSTFNQVSQNVDPDIHNIIIKRFLFNITAFREGASQSNYVVLPYRDTIKVWFTNLLGFKPNFDALVTIIIELEPYEI